MSQQNYLLDLLVEEAQFATCVRSRGMPVWLVMRADGGSKSVTTKPVSPSTAHFHMPVRWVLNLGTLDRAYLKVSLHSSTDDPNYSVIVASAQIRLSDIATHCPQELTFPLLLQSNTSVEAAYVTVQANISPLQFRSTYSGCARGDVPVRSETSQSYRSSGTRFPPIDEMENQQNTQWQRTPAFQGPPIPSMRFTGRGFDWALNRQ